MPKKLTFSLTEDFELSHTEALTLLQQKRSYLFTTARIFNKSGDDYTYGDLQDTKLLRLFSDVIFSSILFVATYSHTKSDLRTVLRLHAADGKLEGTLHYRLRKYDLSFNAGAQIELPQFSGDQFVFRPASNGYFYSGPPLDPQIQDILTKEVNTKVNKQCHVVIARVFSSYLTLSGYVKTEDCKTIPVELEI